MEKHSIVATEGGNKQIKGIKDDPTLKLCTIF